MPRIRWVEYQGSQWRLSALAAAHGLKPQTLASRLDRGLPVARALATGICNAVEAGRRGAAATPWRREAAAAGPPGEAAPASGKRAEFA